MDLLHAYWRMEYISSPKESQDKGHRNPFLELPRLGDDRRALILFRSEFTYIVLNKFPYNPGHCMVIPYREVADLEGLSVEERNDLMNGLVRCQKAIKQIMNPDGFNVGFNFGSAAGAGIPTHLHAHVVPRWNGDTNFMPVLGQTRVLPQALDATWEKLSVQMQQNG